MGGNCACPLVRGAGSCPSGGQGCVKRCVYKWLWAQYGFRHPVCWWVGLCSYLAGGLAWGVPALEPVGCLVGPGLDAKMAISDRAHTDQYSLGLLPLVSLPPQWTTADSYLPRRPSKIIGRPTPGSYGVTALCWVSVYVKPCAYPPRIESASPSPMELLHLRPAGFQSQMLWGFLLPIPDPQAGEGDMGLRTLTLVGEPLWYNYFPVCGLPTQNVWDLIMSQKLPSFYLVVACSFSLNVKYIFCRFQVFFIEGCSVSCDFGVFPRGTELKSFYSAFFPGIEGLLLVWMLAASFFSMCWPLSPWYGVCR